MNDERALFPCSFKYMYDISVKMWNNGITWNDKLKFSLVD